MHFTSSSCTHDFTMDKSLAVQTTAEGQTQPLWQEEGRERERGGGEREIKINSDLASQSQWHVYLLPWQLESTHKLHVSTAMKKAWGNSCCQFSESYTVVKIVPIPTIHQMVKT